MNALCVLTQTELESYIDRCSGYTNTDYKVTLVKKAGEQH
jgi:hypothetical protein